MTTFVLYLVLLKATMTSFAGLASLPIVLDELVVTRPILTEQQINEAIAISRSMPGPAGSYVVSVGYFAGGMPGAVAGWAALITPALLIIPLVHFAGRHVEHPRVKAILEAVVLTSAGLLLAASLPLARAAITDLVTALVALMTIVLLATTKIDTLWIVLGAVILTSSVEAVRTLA